MKLGAIIEWLTDISAFRGQVRLADELGYDVIGVGDTPARAYEMYVSLTVAAHESDNAILTPMVTTPFLRHPVVTATAVSTLRALVGDRVMVAIGSGGSAMHVAGRLGATKEELRECVTAVQDILKGRPASVGGRTTRPLERVHPMPVYVAADHPNSLRLAGEIADGVITTVGQSLELVRPKIAMIRETAERTGRDPDGIEIWGFSYISVRDSRAEANAEIGTALASDLSVRLRRPHIRSTIAPELLGAVEEMERRFKYYDREFRDRAVFGRNARLLEELGLVDFAVDMTGITGNAQEVAGQLDRLESVGISGVLAALPVLSDPEGTLRGLRQAQDLSQRTGVV